jgi:CRISPR/Cas system CSM-associated protein Csm3 (group 7 of RAMP superfamily)
MEPLSIDVPLHIHFESTTHLGTGRSEGLVDRTIRRNAEGRPYVPGSALKGALRMTAERLVGQLNEIAELDPEWRLGLQRRGSRAGDNRCRAPRPEDMCQSRDPCIVCRLFGNVFTGERLRVSDAHTFSEGTANPAAWPRRDAERSSGDSPPTQRRSTDLLTRLRIDRRRKGAEEGALFTSEYDRPDASYAAALTGSVPATPLSNGGDFPAELVLLATTVTATDQIGGEASTGHGKCRLEFGDSPLLALGGDAANIPENIPEDAADEEDISPPYSLDALLAADALRALAWQRFMS